MGGWEEACGDSHSRPPGMVPKVPAGASSRPPPDAVPKGPGRGEGSEHREAFRDQGEAPGPVQAMWAHPRHTPPHTQLAPRSVSCRSKTTPWFQLLR